MQSDLRGLHGGLDFGGALFIVILLKSRIASLTMSYFLPHLPSGWHVDEAIKSEEDRVVVIRFGHDGDSQCMTMDETLYSVAEKVQNFAVIYLTDITEVPDFNKVRWFDRKDAN